MVVGLGARVGAGAMVDSCGGGGVVGCTEQLEMKASSNPIKTNLEDWGLKTILSF